MVKSVLIFVEQNLSMAKYVPTNAIQATHALGLARTRVTMASGLKVDFTARVSLILNYTYSFGSCKVQYKMQLEGLSD